MNRPTPFHVHLHNPAFPRPFLAKSFPTRKDAEIFIANAKPKDRPLLVITRVEG